MNDPIPLPEHIRQSLARIHRWHLIAQTALFIYGLFCVGAIMSLAFDDRWEAYALFPVEWAIIVVLWHWTRIFPSGLARKLFRNNA